VPCFSPFGPILLRLFHCVTISPKPSDEKSPGHDPHPSIDSNPHSNFDRPSTQVLLSSPVSTGPRALPGNSALLAPASTMLGGPSRVAAKSAVTATVDVPSPRSSVPSGTYSGPLRVGGSRGVKRRRTWSLGTSSRGLASLLSLVVA
jgi:hypothetical protein